MEGAGLCGEEALLAKGHAVAARYALLAEMNAIDPRELESSHGEGTRLPAHPTVNTLAQIPFGTGSLGHGLSLCAGMAVGAALNRSDRRFFWTYRSTDANADVPAIAITGSWLHLRGLAIVGCRQNVR